MVKLPEDSGFPAFVAQRIEHLTTDQKVGGSSPSKRTSNRIWLEDSFSSIEFVNCLGLGRLDHINFKRVLTLLTNFVAYTRLTHSSRERGAQNKGNCIMIRKLLRFAFATCITKRWLGL